MLLTRETQTTSGRLHPAERCVEFPLRLLDEHLAELEQQARSAQRTIGQMIRHALGIYLAGVRERCGTDGMWGDSQPDTPSDGPGVLAVTLLFPVSQLAELEALAARCDTTASALIRRVVCSSLLLRSPHQQPPNES
jgi:hypothetical protein